jgi:cytochrome c oxidase assembly factor CtaG
VVFLHANHGSEEDVLWFASALALLAIGGAFLARTSRRKNAAANQAAWIASAGLITVLAATSPPFDSLADRSFSIHMVQHMLLVLLAAPLLAAGHVGPQLLGLLPKGARPRLLSGLQRTRPPGTASSGLLATAIFAVVFWLWHLPGPFDLALEQPAVHVIEHASFLVSAVFFWSAILNRRAAPAITVFLLFVTMMQTGILGALLTLSGTVWYTAYTLEGPLGLGPLGLGPLEEQQLAGLIMWIPANIFFFAALTFVVYRWIRLDELSFERQRLSRTGQVR